MGRSSASRGRLRASSSGIGCNGPDTRYLFENTDDPREFGLDPDKPPVTIVPGAGVDPDEFSPSPEPAAPPVQGRGGGAHDRAEGHCRSGRGGAARARARRAGRAAIFTARPIRRTAAPAREAELRAWSAEPGIVWHGRSHDVAAVWRENHVAMLLTWYREGVPRSLIEAAACGRPIVTTDAPGCRDLVRDRREGMLVPLRDSEAAARALVELASDADLQGAARRGRARALPRAVHRGRGARFRCVGLRRVPPVIC